MFRLIGFLVMFAITAGGYIVFDYRMASRWADTEAAKGLTFGDYLSGLPDRLSNLGGGAASAAGLPAKLADMLPKPPEGWSVRPTEVQDTEAFLPRDTSKADKAGVAAVSAMATADAGSGVELAALTYERGDRKVIIKATRYPNMIFTGTAAIEQRIDLQMTSAEFRGTEFGTVRGLDVTEDLLPEGFRARMFLADVGAQIHLRILTPKRMSDADVVPFLETLHVKAMNADVIDKVEGLGDVPVIVLASALADDKRDAYLADVAARKATETARIEAELARFEAKAETAAAPAAPETGGGFLGKLFGGSAAAEAPETDPAPEAAPSEVTCATGKDGVKRCTVGATD